MEEPPTSSTVIEAPPRDRASHVDTRDEEALFREARAERRWRWACRAVTLLALAALGAGVVVLTTSRGHARAASGNDPAGALPNGSLASLQVAGALAVGPTGALYVADTAHHRVLVRLADGRFRVVAGTGVDGYSGNGGSALHAELSNVSSLAFAAAGSLYLVDGGRIRVITPAGVIDTVAGDDRSTRWIADDTPAASAPLGTDAENDGPSIAVAPDGTLYIATSLQILRLTAHDTLQPVRAIVPAGHWRGRLRNLGNIAVDDRGDIDVSGVNGWAVWEVGSDGRAHQVGSAAGARQSGGNYSVLERAPDGSVDAEDGPTILRVTSDRLRRLFTFHEVDHELFWPTYFTFGDHGEMYLDEIPGDSAWEADQQLISDRDGHLALLWEQHHRTDHDSFGPG